MPTAPTDLVPDLVRTVQQLAACRDIPAIAHCACQAARRLTGCDGVTFVQVDGDSVRYIDEDVVSPLWKGQRFPFASCICGWAITHHEQVVIPDVELDARIPIELYRRTFARSLCIVPIRAHDPLGAIGAYWSTTHSPSAHELEVLQAIADTTIVAMENVRLHAGVQAELEQRRATERELRRAIAAAEAGNRTKSEFLATMSHEFRTPLHCVLGMSELMLDGELPAEQTDMVQRIQASGNALLEVLSNILDFSRLDSGNLALNEAAFDPLAVARKALALVEEQAHAKGLCTALTSGDGVPARAIGDPERVQQVLVHLLGNAVKFTRRGTVGLHVAGDATSLQFTVRDTGIGIAEEDRNRIFRIFTQADSSSTRAFGGTGIGLALSRGLVEAMGGTISLRSEVGAGSAFVVSIPLAPAGHDAAPRRPTGRVLVADDDEVCRHVTVAQLTSLGLSTVVAADGAAAVELMAADRGLDAVLIDVLMPVLDGISATREIRRLERMQHRSAMPIVAFTACTTDEIRRMCLAAGADQVLAKPTRREDLARALAAIRPAAS